MAGRDDDPVRPQPLTAPDDDRPTEFHAPAVRRTVHATREQSLPGSAVTEILKNPAHNLHRALHALVARAQVDLPKAQVDAGATLLIRHEFEFQRRVGYRLCLVLVGAGDTGTVEVQAELDQDGRAIRRGSIISKLIEI